MLSLARLSIRRPKGALAAWLAIGVALSVIGFGVASSLSPSISVVRGTESADTPSPCAGDRPTHRCSSSR